MRWLFALILVAGCRIETVSPGAAASSTSGPAPSGPAPSGPAPSGPAPSGPAPSGTAPEGELWVYTSVYRHVIDALEPQLKAALPGVTIHWFQAGSEKVAAKLEAELAAGGTPCDVLVTSDPFLYERFKREHRWLRYVSPNGLRTPSRYVDLDGNYAAVRLSTMVLVHKVGTPAPPSFAALAMPEWKGEVALGDPLTSGTAFTWAVSMEHALGATYFERLRANEARVAGGNAAVLQKLEGGEAKVGVLLLENALAAKAKGSPIEIAWPSDGAVVVPGYAGIMASTQHAAAAKALIDALLAPAGQKVIAERGDMHAVDPRVPGPRGSISLDELVQRSAPWGDALLTHGLVEGARVKGEFSKAFSR